MKRRAVGLCVGLMLVLGLGAMGQTVLELIAGANAAFDRWSTPFEFSAYREKLETAISLWEQALPLVPEDDAAVRAHVLNSLAQACFEMGEAYLFAPAEREATYAKGRDYALASLRLDPAFDITDERDGFRAAVASASDVAAVFWYGNNLGQYFSYNPLTAITGGVRDVLACYERAAELDETYMGGGPHRSLAALIAQAFFVLGKSRDEALPHYERSIEIDPNYLESYVNYAQHYAIPKGMTELASSLLQTLSEKAKDPAVVAAWPLYNTLAIRRAESLLR